MTPSFNQTAVSDASLLSDFKRTLNMSTNSKIPQNKMPLLQFSGFNVLTCRHRNGENRHISASFGRERAKSSVRIKVTQVKFEGHLMSRNHLPQAVLTDITSIVLKNFLT